VRGSLRGGPVPDEGDSDVVSLAGAACETLNGIENRFLEMAQGCVVPAGKGFVQTKGAEELRFGFCSFGDCIAEEHECFASFEFHAGGAEFLLESLPQTLVFDQPPMTILLEAPNKLQGPGSSTAVQLD